jgi:hypothetical protein
MDDPSDFARSPDRVPHVPQQACRTFDLSIENRRDL